MPLADFDAYKTLLKSNLGGEIFIVDWTSSNYTIRSNDRLMALFRGKRPDNLAAAPTTSVALNNTNTDVAVAPLPNASGKLRIYGYKTAPYQSVNNPNGAMSANLFVDVLNFSGGMNGTITTEQTTNLPTAALTRYTTGEGVMAGLIVWTTVGTTAAGVTVNYTNSDNVSGRTSTSVQFGGANYREAGAVILVPLQSGDKGIRSIEGITLSGSTGTIGDFGVIMFKPLAMSFFSDMNYNSDMDAISTSSVSGGFPELENNACLSMFGFSSSGNMIGALGSVIIGDA
jgi:hypothetical protein